MSTLLEELLHSRGAATPAELSLGTRETLALAKQRPDLEPVFLVRFRSQQNKVRVEEVRAYAWPSHQIGMRHLGYRAEEAKLLRLEPRQRVAFPARLYATFASDPKRLEELRKTEKAYVKAMKQAPSKPGRAERDLAALQTAFKKLGDDVALEMWIEAAATFQRLDNTTYASKMLGALLKLVEKDKKIDASLLARTVLSAADDGVFNAKLYDFTWDLLQKRLSTEAALGLGLRVFRRLMESGRALPTDFIKDLRRAAVNGKVRDFEPLFDRNIVWAAGLASFWNTARRTSEWRDEPTKDHAETQLLRARLGELWRQANGAGDGGAAWKAEVWERIRGVMPELSTYGRTILVEHLLAAGGDTRADAELLLEAALAMLARPARKSDRERVEAAAGAALSRVAAISTDVIWDKSAALEEALRVSTGNLGAFLTLHDLLSDLGESIPARAPASGGEAVPVLRALPGLLAAWTGALVAALKPATANEDEDYDDSNDEDIWTVGPLGEALSLVKPEQAAEHLAELGPLVAQRLAEDLERGRGLEGWERVLGTLRALGPTGEAVTTTATARFVEKAAGDEDFGHAARLAHFLDRDALRRAGEARGVVDEALERMLSEVAPDSRAEPLLRPEKELGEAPQRLDAVRLPDGRYSVLWMARPKDRWSNDPVKRVATVLVSADGKQAVGATGDLKGAAQVSQWVTPDGLRFVALKDQSALLFDEKLDKPIAKLSFGEEGWGDSTILLGARHALIEFKGSQVIVGTDFKVIGELEHKGWGSWTMLDGPEGTLPVAIHRGNSGINALYSAPGKPAPAFKLPDCRSVKRALRTDDGAWCIDYVNKKGAKRRARLDEAQGRWVSSDGAVLPERPVVATCDLDGNDWIPTFGGLGGYATGDSDGHVTISDLLDRPLAILKGPKTLVAFEPKAGFGIGEEQVVWDPTLPARLAAATALRDAITKQPEDALPRGLYADPAGLAAHLEARITARPVGQDALRQLGAAAAPLLRAAADSLMPLLEARAQVLDAVDGPTPPRRTVPPRVPGVPRTLIRRVTRNDFSEPLDGLVFWALDGNDPGPAVEYLLPPGAPAHAEAWSTAALLVGLAQQPRTDPGMAERALALAEAIVRGLEDPERLFELEAEDVLEVDEDDDPEIDGDRGADVCNLGTLHRSHLLWSPWGHFPKKEPPIALPDDPAKRRAALEGWVRDGLLGPVKSAKMEVLLDRGVALQFRATVKQAGAELNVDVVVLPKADGLTWQLRSVSGTATAAQWHGLFTGLQQGFAAASGDDASDPAVWPGTHVVRPELLDALRSGVALTRAHLANREQLRPESWEAPALKGVESPEYARYVMLAWLLGSLEAEQMGTTKPVFEKVAKQAAKWVDLQSWYGRLTRKQGNKTGDEVRISPELSALLRTALVRRSGGRRDGAKLSEDLIVLKDPAELVAAYAQELGLTTAKAGGKKA